MNYKALFTASPEDLGIGSVISYLNILNEETKQYVSWNNPCIRSNQIDNSIEYLKDSYMRTEGAEAADVLRKVAELTAGLPLWNHPGTMLNVIPPVNLVAAAAGAFADVLNVNFSQGHYSGNMVLAELKVAKYMSDLVGWDWMESGGIFTFGGKGTSLYALKNAINRAYPQGKEEGYDTKFFFLSSAKGHPCHAEVAEWLGIGKKSCIRVPTWNNGKIKIKEAERLIAENIQQGMVFLGCILSGGSTVELEVDDIYAVRELMERTRDCYNLSYSPWIHVDSVVGWPWLFYNDYDFGENALRLSDQAMEKIRSMSQDISGICAADSFGADFHKTGFCPYVSSLFMCRSNRELCQVSNHTCPAEKNDDPSRYSPFEYSLELSRSAKGAVSALAALETMGKNGYRRLIADLVENTCALRNLLATLPFVELLNSSARGFATLFVLKPPQYEACSLSTLLELPLEDTEVIKKYNVRFGNFVEALIEQGLTSVNFTSTDTFAVNNTNVYLGMVKLYPMSVLQNNTSNEAFVSELCRLKAQFDSHDQSTIADVAALDMVYRK